MIITLLASVLLVAQSQTLIQPSMMPQNALQRIDPKLWGLQFDVQINTLDVKNKERPFRMPLIVDGPWSQIKVDDSLNVFSMSGNTLQVTKTGKRVFNGKGLRNERMLHTDVPLEPARFANIRLQAEVAAWGAKIDEKRAAQSSWPSSWPESTKSSLQPQTMIESDSAIFKETIDSLFDGKLRSMSPWIAAKRIVYYTCTNVQITGSRSMYSRRGTRGLNIQGAALTAQTGKGTRADLACTCVAMLRAAGIPARPVVGLSAEVDNGEELTAWAEFFLPGSGWVPFSPWQMKNAGLRSWKIERSWRFFGNWKDLNENIAIAWSFAPGDGTTVHDTWGIWGWTRAIPGSEIPPSEMLCAENPYTPSKISVRIVSGGSLNERKFNAWLEGENRPLFRRNR